MNPFLSIPRESLAELLRASGSPLTPEQYLASLQEQNSAFKKYPRRAWVAATSKYFILVVALAAVLFLPVMGFTLENMIIAVGLCVVTFYEYRVHRYFRENNPQAPGLGFRNQSAFATAILIYCLYHAFATFRTSPEMQSLVEENNLIDVHTLSSMVRVFYLVIGVVAGGSQFALAWYYRNAARP